MNKSQKKQLYIELAVGALILFILFILGTFTILLSRENIFKKSYPLVVKFKHVEGLIAGDNVVLRGVKVGVVKKIEVQPDGANVYASLEYPAALHKDYRVQIISSSVLGGHVLEVNEGSLNAPLLEKGTELVGIPPADFMKDLAEAVVQVKGALLEGGILDHFKSTMTNLDKITTKISQGEGTMGRLVMDDSLYRFLDGAAEDLQQITDKLQRGEGTIGHLLTDDKVYNDLQLITSNLVVVSGVLRNGEGTIGKLLTDDRLYYDLGRISSNITVVTDRLVLGEGTLGKLSKQDDLYENINKLVQEGRAMLDDLRETSPIVSFASIMFGAF